MADGATKGRVGWRCWGCAVVDAGLGHVTAGLLGTEVQPTRSTARNNRHSSFFVTHWEVAEGILDDSPFWSPPSVRSACDAIHCRHRKGLEVFPQVTSKLVPTIGITWHFWAPVNTWKSRRETYMEKIFHANQVKLPVYWYTTCMPEF